jgi:hypothetical protein
MGSNSEKEYIYKTATLFSGITVKANYFQSSLGMLSGMFLKLYSLKKESNYIIDPVTYVFGLDPNKQWSILSWQKEKKEKAEVLIQQEYFLNNSENIQDRIKAIEDPKFPADNEKCLIKILKKGYKSIADYYFNHDSNIRMKVGKFAIKKDDFNNSSLTLKDFTNNVISYQQNSIKANFQLDKINGFIIPDPLMILSPYFLINDNESLMFMRDIWKVFSELYTKENGANVLLTNIKYLKENFDNIISYLSSSTTNNIFFWFDGFEEECITEEDIITYVNFISILSSEHKKLFNMYGGGYSPLLFPFGLSGIINGPGYGLDRDVEPVQGGVPSAQYFIPTLRRRLTVSDAYDIIVKNHLGNSPELFYKQICNCPFCKEGIKDDISDFTKYYGIVGDLKVLKNGKERRFSTRECIERTVYHFILSRLIEFQKVKVLTKADVIQLLNENIKLWPKEKHNVGYSQLELWKKVLEKYV